MIIIPAILYFLAVNSWKKSVEEFIYQLVNDNITKYSSQIDSDFYVSKLDTHFEIIKIDYYKYLNITEIVPVLELNANNQYVSKEKGSVVLREICDNFYYSDELSETIERFGSAHIIANGTVIEPDKSSVYVDRYSKYKSKNESKKFIPYSNLMIPYILYCIIILFVLRKKIRSVNPT